MLNENKIKKSGEALKSAGAIQFIMGVFFMGAGGSLTLGRIETNEITIGINGVLFFAGLAILMAGIGMYKAGKLLEDSIEN